MEIDKRSFLTMAYNMGVAAIAAEDISATHYLYSATE